MTYCVGLKISDGLVFLSDTRTNAGVDNIARFRKMFTWSVKGQRAIAIVTSGNLSITQGVITRLNQDIQRSQSEDVESIILGLLTLRGSTSNGSSELSIALRL